VQNDVTIRLISQLNEVPTTNVRCSASKTMVSEQNWISDCSYLVPHDKS